MPLYGRMGPRIGKTEGKGGWQRCRVYVIRQDRGCSAPGRRKHGKRGRTRPVWCPPRRHAKWTSSVHTVQRVDDLLFVWRCGPGAENTLWTRENGFLHSHGPRGDENGVARCGLTPCRALAVWTRCHRDSRAVAARSPLHNVAPRPGHLIGPLVDDH